MTCKTQISSITNKYQLSEEMEELDKEPEIDEHKANRFRKI